MAIVDKTKTKTKKKTQPSEGVESMLVLVLALEPEFFLSYLYELFCSWVMSCAVNPQRRPGIHPKLNCEGTVSCRLNLW